MNLGQVRSSAFADEFVKIAVAKELMAAGKSVFKKGVKKATKKPPKPRIPFSAPGMQAGVAPAMKQVVGKTPRGLPPIPTQPGGPMGAGIREGMMGAIR